MVQWKSAALVVSANPMRPSFNGVLLLVRLSCFVVWPSRVCASACSLVRPRVVCFLVCFFVCLCVCLCLSFWSPGNYQPARQQIHRSGDRCLGECASCSVARTRCHDGMPRSATNSQPTRFEVSRRSTTLGKLVLLKLVARSQPKALLRCMLHS